MASHEEEAHAYDGDVGNGQEQRGGLNGAGLEDVFRGAVQGCVDGAVKVGDGEDGEEDAEEAHGGAVVRRGEVAVSCRE